MSLADKFTVLRIILIPFFIVLLYLNIPFAYLYAALVFIIASLTDILDGYFARKYHTVGDFGKVFDPIADKLLVISALVVFTELELVPAWFVIVLIAREFIISGYRIMVSSKGCSVVAANWLGKLKTITQDIFIVMVLLKSYLPFIGILYLDDLFMYAALIFTMWSLTNYIVEYTKVLKRDGN